MMQRNYVPVFLIASSLGLVLASSSRTEEPKQPHSAVKPQPREGGWMNRHKTFAEMARKGGIEVLFLGDSITDAWGGEGHYAKAKGIKVLE